MRRTKPAPSTPNKHRLPSFEQVAPAPCANQWNLPSPRQLAWLLVHNPENLTEQETIIVAHLQADPDISTVYPLTQQFASMIRERSANLLDAWLDFCLNAGVVQLYNFAIGLQQDYAAIRAALETPWSNGQKGGHIRTRVGQVWTGVDGFGQGVASRRERQGGLALAPVLTHTAGIE